MRQRGLRTAVLAAALVTPLRAGAQTGRAAPPAQTPVEVTTTLSRTAAWVGDRILYTVELRTLPQFDIVLEDLGEDRLRVEGGEVQAVEESQETGGPRGLRRVRFTLVANRADATSLRVPALVVRYYERRDDQTPGAPSGQVIVPAAAVPIRSTLPDGGAVEGPRSPTSFRLAPRWLRLAGPVGITLILVTILPVLLYLLRAGPRARAAWGRIKAMRERRRRRHAFADVKVLAPSSDADRIAAFERLDAFLRDHLEANAAVPAFALTPGELGQALAVRGGAFDPEDVQRLLETCERARYAPAAPSHDDWTNAVQEAEHIVSHGGR